MSSKRVGIASYLVELYLPRSRADGVAKDAARARAAADELALEGKLVRYVRTIFVPEDEICFHVYEASSMDVVQEAGLRAGLAFDRVVEATDPHERTQ